MRFRLRDLADNEILAGAVAGRRILRLLLERIDREPTAPEPVYLDFQGVEVATASFLREEHS